MPIVIFGSEPDTEELILDGFSLTDEAFVVLTRSVEETIVFSDETDFLLMLQALAEDGIRFQDDPKLLLWESLADGVSFGETVLPSLGLRVSEYIFLSSLAASNWMGSLSAAEIIRFQDVIGFNKFFEVLLEETLELYETLIVPELVTLYEQLILSDTLSNTGVFGHTVLDTLNLVEKVLSIFVITLDETLSFNEALAVKFLMSIALQDGILFEDESVGNKLYDDALSEEIDLADALSVIQLLQCLIEDGFQFDTEVEIMGEPWQCCVLSTPRFHPSIYSGFDFNSFTIHDEKAYGLKADGLYILEGQSDAGDEIYPGVMFMPTTFGTHAKKRMVRAYFGMLSDGNPAIRVETENGAETYRIKGNKASISRRFKGRQWKFIVEGFTTLDFVELVPVLLTR